MQRAIPSILFILFSLIGYLSFLPIFVYNTMLASWTWCHLHYIRGVCQYKWWSCMGWVCCQQASPYSLKGKAKGKCYLDQTHFDETFYISYIIHIQDLNKFNIQDKEIQGIILRCISIQSSVALTLQINKNYRQQNRSQIQVQGKPS